MTGFEQISDEDFFWGRADCSGDCWYWDGPLSNGYGRFRVGKRTVLAHRHAWELTHGKIPQGHVIRHLCGESSCVNPVHLELISRKDLSVAARGVRKLTDNQVLAIREDNRIQREIAADYGVSIPMISYIKSGRRRNHVEGGWMG